MTVVRRRTAAALVLTLGVVASASACSSGSEEYRPTGVDGLVVPTPSPDPGDFVDGVDNAWLPLEPGTTWEYRSTGGRRTTTLSVTVEKDLEDVAGVAATVSRAVVRDREGLVVADLYDWFAQDTGGNVWALGEENVRHHDHGVTTPHSWRAGDDGALAGLAMPSAPRVGDGFAIADLPGADPVASVVDTAGTASVPAGRYDDLVVLEVRTGERTVREYYAAGVGLVRAESSDGAVTELVAHHPAG